MSEPVSTTELEQPRERPFPWHCPRCRRKEVRREAVNYQCQRIRDGQPVTVSIADFKVPRCSACGELVFDYFAAEQIEAAYLRQFPAPSSNGPIAVPGSSASAKTLTGDTEILEGGNIGS